MNEYGIIGYPLKHSLSPLFWNLYFKRKNIDAFYKKIEIPPQENINLKNYKGLNITTPWKEKILKYVENFDEVVLKTKSANTLLVDKKIYAYNTDFYGFSKLIEEVKINSKNVVILGTGGAAKTCGYYFKTKNYNVIFLSRDKKGEIIGFKIERYENAKNILESADLIINATSCGWKGELPPLNFDYIKKSFLIDLQYGRETPFLKEGKKRGFKGIDGKIMLLYQAIYAGKIWFSDFDEKIFKECFEEVFNARNFKNYNSR